MNYTEEYLILSIFKQAIVDILACPIANPDPSINYRKGSARHDSADAKRFISPANPTFRIYCDLLGIDPKEAE